jgi:hypothetical protein
LGKIHRSSGKVKSKRKIASFEQRYNLHLLSEYGLSHSKQEIRSKLDRLHSSIQKATDWLNSTGSGILEADAENCMTTVKQAVEKQFPYYYKLVSIFGESPKAAPISTSETLNSKASSQRHGILLLIYIFSIICYINSLQVPRKVLTQNKEL